MARRLLADRTHDKSALDDTVQRLTRFVKQQTELAKARHLIIGMSGGLDSSVTAAICALAVGGDRILGLSLPEEETYHEENIRDAQAVASKFGIKFQTTDISEPLRSIKALIGKKHTKKDLVAWGNVKARLRALILYYHANISNGLVVGTGDKSEQLLGYYSKFGDGACDIQPLADVYKTSVRQLAIHLKIPSRIAAKEPSPNLWRGQTAERELGMGYEKIDSILSGLERWVPANEIASELGISLRDVLKVRERWRRSEHKRRMPLTVKLGFRTVGMDFRLPYNME